MYGLNTKMLWGRLLTSCAKVEVQWALSHSDVEGNKIADTAAKAATLLNEDSTDIPYVCASSLIKRSINDDISSRPRAEEVYSKFSSKKAEIKDQVILARIWSGHHWSLESYHKLVDEEHDHRYKVCEDQPKHNLNHFIYKCEQTDALRMECFGTTGSALEVQTENPHTAIAFTREALRLLQATPKKQQRCTHST